jgi:hypothetical protein
MGASVAAAVLGEAVGLLPLQGLTVPSLRFPVNPELPLVAAFTRTVGLAPEAPPAHEERRGAEVAVNLDEKQETASNLADSRKP